MLASNPAHGTVNLATDGSFSYTPTPNFFGTDKFTYRFTSNGRTSNVATATINVAAGSVNDSPVAGADTASTVGTTPVVIAVLTNDTDPDTNPLSVTSVSAPTKGTAATDGTTVTYTYTDTGTLPTTDTFNYTISDGSGGSATASVTITIDAPFNPPPVANDDRVTIQQNTTLTNFDVTANDSDTAPGVIVKSTVTIIRQPNFGGTVVNHGDGTVTYTPRKNFRGTEMFSYIVQDNGGATSNQAWVRVDVVR